MSKDEGTELPGLQITHRARKVPTQWTFQGHKQLQMQNKTPEPNREELFFTKRNSPLRNRYIFNTSDLDSSVEHLDPFLTSGSIPCSLSKLLSSGIDTL